MSSLIFGKAQSANRDILGELYQQPVKSVLSVPINFPFTCFYHSLQAREKTRTIILQFCCISDDEIVDSAINIMIAGHDTTTILSFLIKLLANDPSVYGSIVQAWDDLARMKICSNGVSKNGSSCVLFLQDDSQKDGRNTSKNSHQSCRIVSRHLEEEFECVRDMNLQDLQYDHYTLPGETFHMEAMPPKHFLSSGSIASF
ncbi:hypothetical protein POTOM_045390 [Populus tomentosa]|uniref:Uncharacterized protein n=1 Tax=Populus tomentosa TaxID=118781 RepID=A0A8X8CDY0_POPTO|nr:hypothetical protein POTOM_045390 [Populus tomentosa]